MAFQIWLNGDYDVVDEPDFMNRALEETRHRGVDHETIGGPDRAVKTLLTLWRNHDDDTGTA